MRDSKFSTTATLIASDVLCRTSFCTAILNTGSQGLQIIAQLDNPRCGAGYESYLEEIRGCKALRPIQRRTRQTLYISVGVEIPVQFCLFHNCRLVGSRRNLPRKTTPVN